MFPLQKIIVSLLVIFISQDSLGGDPYRIVAGAGQAGMAGVTILNNDPWSAFSNQALLAYRKSVSFGFNYEDRFMLKELGTRSAGLIIPAGSLSFGAAYSHFGYSNFSRQSFGLACGKRLSDIIAAGVQIDYFSESMTGEDIRKQALTWEGGLVAALSGTFRLGIHFFNPVPNSVRKTDLVSGLRAGAYADFSKDLTAGCEAGITSAERMFLRTGFEYAIVEKCIIRGGFSTENNSFCFGLGYRNKPVAVDFGFSTHERLGLTTSLSLVFIPGKK